MNDVKHAVDFYVQSHWARYNALAWSYFSIAESAYGKFLEAYKHVMPITMNEDPSEYFEVISHIRESSFQTIVFSAMSCETAIFDLAATQLGDDYASKYLDKLDLVSKWMIVRSLICGRSFKPDGPAINSLRSLTKVRNLLVHHKSQPADAEPKSIRQANQQMGKIIRATDEAFRTVILLSLELNRVLGIRLGVLPSFELDVVSFPDSNRPEALSSVISRCREIDAKNL